MANLPNLPIEVEDHVLQLRRAGWSRRAIARHLVREGYRDDDGEPLSNALIHRAEGRARVRSAFLLVCKLLEPQP